MRIRQVKPEFWRDATLAEMNDTARLVYIGLWMEADDAGYLRLNPTELAMDLFPLTPRATRERRLRDALAILVASDRVQPRSCQRHAVIPTLTVHQRLSSPERQVTTIAREHASGCPEDIPAETRGDPRGIAASPLIPERERKGKGRVNGRVEGGVLGGTGATPLVDRRELSASSSTR